MVWDIMSENRSCINMIVRGFPLAAVLIHV